MKWKNGFLCIFLMILFLTGCREPVSQVSATEPEDTTTTLMLYMIGSDLEAKAGAATKDLLEIESSGLDLSRVNVVVYAGGSPHWHNEDAAAEEHSLLYLTAEGFVKATATTPSSMGEAQCLSRFLTYAHDNFPADEYALILWDHGDGPVIGYGRDMLFDNDTLTLREMEQALTDSPFGADAKLSWVGFDACLMASAELACIWAPYAEYLVASQEVEPSFGWDYSALASLGSLDTPAFLGQLTDRYLQTCLAYYESRGYDHRDTTLACLALTSAEELSAAIDALFTKAAGDVADNYHTLTAKRVQTRALGRATTGSEYDLIDLSDLAHQLADLYPEETARVQKAVQNIVIANATNAEGCCGLSLYYPFYNKDYYEDAWGDAYSQLGLFPSYQNYLQNYQAIWLKNDLLDAASSQMPSVTAQNQYVLELQQSQAASFASARYYILRREGNDLYTRIFSSQDVTRQGSTLIANYDGDILYAKNDLGQWLIPVSQEHDTAGQITRYSVWTNLNNSPAFGYFPEGYEFTVESFRFQLAVNNRTKEISVSALTAWDEEADAVSLAGGKSEEVDLSQWTNYIFLCERNRYLTRYENGTIQPVADWPYTDFISYYQMPIGNGLEFYFAPLIAGEYYLLFEIEDTQGNRYCSDLLPIEADGAPPEAVRPDPIDVDFTTGDRVLLTDRAGIELYMCLYTQYDTLTYGLEVVNHNDFPVYVKGSDMYINGNTYCPYGALCYTVVEPNATSDRIPISFDVPEDLCFPDGLSCLQFTLNVENALNCINILHDQILRIGLHDPTPLNPYGYWSEYTAFTRPTRSILAPEQVLLETEDLRITLLGLGGNPENTGLWGGICMENLSDETLYLEPYGASFDGIFMDIHGSSVDIPPHCKVYDDLSIDAEELDLSAITSAREIFLLFQTKEFLAISGGGGFAQQFALPVTLTHSGAPAKLPEGNRVLFEEDGVRITYLFQETSGSSYSWYITVTNTTDRYLSLDMTDTVINGTALENSEYGGQSIFDSELGPHQSRIARISFIGNERSLESLAFRFQIMDFNGEAILYTGTTPITILPEPVPEADS